MKSFNHTCASYPHWNFYCKTASLLVTETASLFGIHNLVLGLASLDYDCCLALPLTLPLVRSYTITTPKNDF